MRCRLRQKRSPQDVTQEYLNLLGQIRHPLLRLPGADAFGRGKIN